MRKKFIARLSEEERDELRTVIRETVIRQLKGTGQKVRRAQILLKADAERRRMPREGGCREKADAERRRMPREGGCRGTELDRRADRGGVFLPGIVRGKDPSAAGRAGIPRDARRSEARQAADRETPERQAAGAGDRPVSGTAAGRLRELVAAALGPQGRGTGGRGSDRSRSIAKNILPCRSVCPRIAASRYGPTGRIARHHPRRQFFSGVLVN